MSERPGSENGNAPGWRFLGGGEGHFEIRQLEHHIIVLFYETCPPEQDRSYAKRWCFSVLKSRKGGLTCEVVVIGQTIRQQLEDSIATQGIVIVLIVSIGRGCRTLGLGRSPRGSDWGRIFGCEVAGQSLG